MRTTILVLIVAGLIIMLLNAYTVSGALGINWVKEDGIRIDAGGTYDSKYAQTSDIFILDDGTYRMYYNGYDGSHKRILSATSSDDITWTKDR